MGYILEWKQDEFQGANHHSDLGAVSPTQHKIVNFHEHLPDQPVMPEEDGVVHKLCAFSYYLSHLFTAWTGSVPTPNMAKYADVACKHCIQLLAGEIDDPGGVKALQKKQTRNDGDEKNFILKLNQTIQRNGLFEKMPFI